MNVYENMRTFVRLVETGSVSGTAEDMEVAKSAVSRRLKELEAHLNSQLFQRTTRKLTITDTGQAYYQQCLRLLADLEEVEQTISTSHYQLKGGLKISLPASLGLHHMNSVINEFVKQHPEMRLQIDFNDRQVDLVQEGFDIAIRIADLKDAHLIAKRLFPIHLVMCASPDYLRIHGTPNTLEQLCEHRCLTYSLVSNREAWKAYDSSGCLNHVNIQPYLQSSSGEYLRDVAVAGMGIAKLPTFIVYKELAEGKLQVILDDYQTHAINAYVVYPQTRHLSKRVRVFVDFLTDQFQGVPYWDAVL